MPISFLEVSVNKQTLIDKIAEFKSIKKRSKVLDDAINCLEQSLSIVESTEKKLLDANQSLSNKDTEISELNGVINSQREELDRAYSDNE